MGRQLEGIVSNVDLLVCQLMMAALGYLKVDKPVKPSPQVGVFHQLYSANPYPYPNLPASSTRAGLQTHRIPYSKWYII